ncbi:hypothetical protein STEG23_030954 [Scotinomys teguina]
MARKAGQGKEEEESRARQQEEKTPVREEEEKPACHGGAHHVVEQAPLFAGLRVRTFTCISTLLYLILQIQGCASHACSARGDQKGVSVSLTLKLHKVVDHYVSLAIGPSPLEEQPVLLTA